MWHLYASGLVGMGLACLGMLASGRSLLFVAGLATTTSIVGVIAGTWHPTEARVELFDSGVAVVTREGREVTFFDDVDAVWFELRGGQREILTAIRLVDRRENSHRVPLGVDGAGTAAAWIVRQCSEVLLDDARAALSAGEVITFGDVQIDRKGIVLGAAMRIAWEDIRLVRFSAGSIFLFRAFPILPWRTIRLDRVPHPTVLSRLVRELAPRTS